ncbi:hypothetical protein [Roseibacillus ishigakijimensis]|uniref:Uncharacterized protein n=1 Tax=Roseibacillus ishigakijimensis TaxID=454146 RepID=A0A934RLF7_9BACT|nr:hypothetical protein [Roseibacillus ishigakijimensis]MBK1833902.1 hypothetical protein [Roseibacillus ishigakijimensis]
MSQNAKKNEQVLLFPGAEGWEIWRGTEEFSLLKATGEREALAVEGVPKGLLTMAFPVRDVSAAPFLAATGEQEMFRDLADLHLERSGLRAEDAAGSLSDCFTLSTGEEEATLLPVVLSPPPEGGLPKKSPKAFDVSARCLPLPPLSVVLWREFGRWVFAVSDAQGQTLYFQALPGALFDAQLSREVALGTAQLSMQELLPQPLQQCLVWTGESEIPPAEEAMAALGQILGIPVSAAEKPAPRLPQPLSQLLPADIRAERLALQKARQTKMAIAAVVLCYLGAIGYFAYKFNEAKKRTDLAEQRAAASGPVAEEVATFTSKWEELKPIVENQFWPLEQYYNAYLAAPKEGLKLTEIEMHNEIDYPSGEARLRRFMILEGESEKAEQAVQFGENLTRSSYFSEFQWSIVSPTPTNRDTWSFRYQADPVGAAL